MQKLRCENSKVKAIVMIIETELGRVSIDLNVRQCIPFASIEKAQDYIDNDLQNIGMDGLLIVVNEPVK